MSYEIHKEPQVHGSAAEQLRLQLEHLKRTVKSPYELIEHVIQLYGAEFEKATERIAALERENAELHALLKNARDALRALAGSEGAHMDAAAEEAHRRKAEDTPC